MLKYLKLMTINYFIMILSIIIHNIFHDSYQFLVVFIQVEDVYKRQLHWIYLQSMNLKQVITLEIEKIRKILC